MKIKIYAALIAAASIALFSCDWFSKKTKKSNPLIGNWKLDSIDVGKDSSLVHAFVAIAIKEDSNAMELKFTQDSFLISGNKPDTAKYWFNEKSNQLVVKESTDELYSYHRINDSTVSLTAKDSSVLFLKKR